MTLQFHSKWMRTVQMLKKNFAAISYSYLTSPQDLDFLGKRGSVLMHLYIPRPQQNDCTKVATHWNEPGMREGRRGKGRESERESKNKQGRQVWRRVEGSQERGEMGRDRENRTVCIMKLPFSKKTGGFNEIKVRLWFLCFFIFLSKWRESQPGDTGCLGWDWGSIEIGGGKENGLTFSLCSYESFDLLQYWDDYVTAVEPSRKTTLKEENWGTAERKEKREIIMESWVLPRRQVLDLRGQSSQQPKRVVWDQYTPKHGRQSEVRGKEQERHFYPGPGSGIRLQKELAAGLKVGWAGPWVIQHHLNTKFSSECWERTQNLALEMRRNIMGRDLPTSFFLHPNSQCSFLDHSRKVWMNHLLVIYLPEWTIVLHLFTSPSKDILFHVALPPTVCNQCIGVTLSRVLTLLTHQLWDLGGMFLNLSGL